MADDKKYEDLLAEYSTPEERQSLESLVDKAEQVPTEQSPSDITNSRTPDIKDSAKPVAGQEDMLAEYNSPEVGEELQAAGLEVEKEPQIESPIDAKPEISKDEPEDLLAEYENEEPQPAGQEKGLEKEQDDMER